MELSRIQHSFSQLGNYLSSDLQDPPLLEVIQEAGAKNPWFTRKFISMALKAWGKSLNRISVEKWLSPYAECIAKASENNTIGLVLAGNFPLAGLQDILCVLACGQTALIKLSAQDDVLIPFILKLLTDWEPRWAGQLGFSERLSGFDKVIATGSNNTSRYFEYYFGKYPHIIRKNRSSVGILHGSESASDLAGLGLDIFSYFGLGCRNVSKIYVPEAYPLALLTDAFDQHAELTEGHHKYLNNYDYQLTLLIMNKAPYTLGKQIILRESKDLYSPISVVNYETYKDFGKIEKSLADLKESIQVISSGNGWYDGSIPFGASQQPELWDYADNIDTMDFLLDK